VVGERVAVDVMDQAVLVLVVEDEGAALPSMHLRVEDLVLAVEDRARRGAGQLGGDVRAGGAGVHGPLLTCLVRMAVPYG
jgi:hypothetical protein